jgi:hypothetical protein
MDPPPNEPKTKRQGPNWSIILDIESKFRLEK